MPLTEARGAGVGSRAGTGEAFPTTIMSIDTFGWSDPAYHGRQQDWETNIMRNELRHVLQIHAAHQRVTESATNHSSIIQATQACDQFI